LAGPSRLRINTKPGTYILLGGFGAMGKGEKRRGTGSGFGGQGRWACSTIFGELLCRFGVRRSRVRFVFFGGRVSGCFGLHNAVNVLIRNLPTKVVEATALLNVLFEKDGTAGIAYKGARSREHDIANTIIDGDCAAEKF
jgi:hypothetical protein